ncbi:streptogramin lyase [Povalibacter uvarum]|uniref:Streptogramin lyase n=1 Tax=Povalibacter uvarum TaxID=732238 RepID=A0A841HHG9_9GAMM|nr:hypothetical protein [Povalibacter uvarum]MBB6092407.1 streptogramin lyase [Povalibacter uvarum]
MNRTASVVIALMTVGGAASAGTLTGTIKDDAGKPVAGVIVRVTESVPNGNSEVVYSNAQGLFSLQTALNGKLEVRLRSPYLEDLKETLILGQSDAASRDYKMKRMTDPQQISDSLPAGYHFGQLPFETAPDSPFTKYQFQRDCLTCHALGNSLTRFPRTPEGWVGTIERMHRYLGNFDKELREKRAVILSKGLDGKPLKVRPVFPIDPEVFTAKVYEYPMPKSAQPHDAAVSPADGLVYTVDQASDLMAVTDLATRQTKYFPHPKESKPAQTVGTMSGSVVNGPHSLALGPDGKWYTTNTFTSRIGVFNPKTMQWEPSIEIGSKANYPHTIRFDKQGIAWFTISQSEQVGRLDPKTREVKVLDLPPVKSLGTAFVTVPYGIDVSPIDGTIWYTRLFGDKVGRIDPNTLQLKEYQSPVKGPRRMRFDKQGVLWLTGYSDGILARLKPKDFASAEGFTSELYPLPQFAKGYEPAPYALGVHPQTQDIWINENLTDRMFRFIPGEKRFVVYPMPLRGTYTRDFSFTADGRACTTNNPSPAAALEGGVQELFCIAP